MTAPTIGDLFEAKTVTDDEVNVAVDVFMRDATSIFQFANSRTINLAAAVEADQPARVAIADPDRSDKFRRGMVRTAILLARPAAP